MTAAGVARDRHRPVEVTCEHCRATVVRASRSVNAAPQRYCTRACATAAAITLGKFRGENNPSFAGWKSLDKVAYRERFQAKYPEKAAAHLAVKVAKRRGELVPQPCETCGVARAHAHHEDYSKPLDVRWLCRPCHHAEHGGFRGPRGEQPRQRRQPRPPRGTFVWRGLRRSS